MGVISNDLNEDTYIGLELPLTHTGDGFFKRTKTALEQAKSNIKTLLLTNKGERLGNPTFGTNPLVNVLTRNVNLSFTLNVDVTSKDSLSLDLSTYSEIGSIG